MVVYWSMLALTAVLAVLEQRIGNCQIYLGKRYLCKGKSMIAIFWASYLVFWIGLRSGIADTNAYIQGFHEIPVGKENLIPFLRDTDKGVGFQFLAFTFKNYISTNYHGWLFFLAAVSLLPITKVFCEQSESFCFTAYLFIATTMFSWLFNGVRQFLAVAILFAFSEWLIENKTIRYLLLILLVASIHNTAIVMIPVCLLMRKNEPWTARTFIIIIVFVLIVYFADPLLELFIQTDIGSGYAEELEKGSGTSIIRIFVSLVPCVLAFVCRDNIKTENVFIKVCVYMSVFSACFYVFSYFTSGVLMGRLPVYFEIYNMILLPRVLKNGFKKNASRFIEILCVVLYLIYFYYQMEVVWSLDYMSDFTGRI